MVHINDNRHIKLTCTIDQVSLKQWALKQDHWKPKLLIPLRSLWQTLEKKSCTSPKIFLCAQKSESDPRKHPQVLMQSRSPGQLPTATSYVTPSISALYHKNHRVLPWLMDLLPRPLTANPFRVFQGKLGNWEEMEEW